MKLIITIDTEEDNWGCFQHARHTVENIGRLSSVQELFDEFNVRPTYLITYPVAADEKAVSILRAIEQSGRCEIGAHCHAWSTPPFEEAEDEKNSMLCNLPAGLQFKKLRTLHETIIKNLGIAPVSFRSGRWDYNHDVARNLYRLGYTIDTSITPYTDWTKYHGTDFSDISAEPFAYCDGFEKRASSPYGLIEVPATIDYLQEHTGLNRRIKKLVAAKSFSGLRLTGILYRLNIVNKVMLCPEIFGSKDMIALTKKMVKRGHKVVNMFFHSPTLTPGLTPFVRTTDDVKRFLRTIREYLEFARDNGIGSIKLSESVDVLRNDGSPLRTFNPFKRS
ncbi:MAG: polysaccharide deacetylase family protein [Deltaproteobacteria bacterium]|nr:polysaccharide deacetylase family protein [Deltaproteobacteria bacterium]